MSTPFWKLRRLASRAIRVVQRRKSEFPVLNAHEGRIIPKASAFIATYDAAARYQTTWQNELAQGRSAAASLAKVVCSWMPLVKRDIPNFHSEEFIDRPTVADDVIEDANRFYYMITDFRKVDGQPLDYQKDCQNSLDAALKLAVKETQEAEAADKKYQDLMRQTREAAADFDVDLIALRSTLASMTSRRDKDYQKLRVQQAQYVDEEDDPNAPAPPTEVTPADPGTNLPGSRSCAGR